MKHFFHTLYHGTWIVAVIIIGIAAASFLLRAGSFAFSYFNDTVAEATEPVTTVTVAEETPLPEKTYYSISSAPEPTTSARAYLVADLETGQIITSNARKVSLPIASITKMMTALVAYTQIPPDTEVTVSKRALETEGWRGNLTAGETLKVHDLLYPLLLESSNDAAEVIAESIGRDAFMNEMNRKARQIGMKNTFFDDPSGLSADNTATAEDLFTLLKHIQNNYPQILDITLADEHEDSGHEWHNLNRMKSAEVTFTGGKTGYTSAAKRTGLAVFTLPLSGGEERKMGVVILGSDNREGDIDKIISYMQKNIHYGDANSLKTLYKSNSI